MIKYICYVTNLTVQYLTVQYCVLEYTLLELISRYSRNLVEIEPVVHMISVEVWLQMLLIQCMHYVAILAFLELL
jgi:hypothetical protein